MTTNILTQDELKEQLHYDPETGVFTRKISNIPHVKVGDIAGGINHYGYSVISINNKIHYAHRLAWLYVYGEITLLQIDHINNIKSDNRLCNLRIANKSENMRNRSKQINNTSGYKGVYFRKDTKKYVARISINRKCKNLGCFETAELAYMKYIEASKIYHGEFSRG